MASLPSKMTPDLQKQGFIKESFGFKMSKKVAELTQVVHMLFSRNHEREVELDALRATYEDEMLRVIKEARNNSEKLEFLLRDATRQRQRDVVQAADNTVQLLKETQERMETMKQDLAEERSQTMQFREMLSQAQKDLERTKQGTTGVSETLEQTNRRLAEREAELVKLRSLYKNMEVHFKSNEKELEDNKVRFGLSEQKLAESQVIISRLNKALDESNKRAEELSKKYLQVDEELKFAKRELKRKTKDNKLNNSKLGPISFTGRNNRKDEEIEALKREIERLRLELSNREGNFNRVFAKFQPVVVSSDVSPQKLHNNRMMMVTPGVSDLDMNKRYLPNSVLNSVRTGSESPFLPKATASASGVHYVSLTPTSGSQTKSANSAHGLEQPKLSASSRNGSPNIRLVYSK